MQMVVAKNSVDITRGMLGGLKLNYRCPNCKEKLVSNEEMAIGKETCPSCGHSFVFDDSLRQELSERKEKQRKQSRLEEELQAEAALIADRERKRKALNQEKQLKERAANIKRWQNEQQPEKVDDIYEDYPALRVYQAIGTIAIALLGMITCWLVISFCDALFNGNMTPLLTTVFSWSVGSVLGAALFIAVCKEVIKVLVRIESNTRPKTN